MSAHTSNFLRSDWERLSGQTDWLQPGVPKSGLVHVCCGRTEVIVKEQQRTLYDGPGFCSGGEMIVIARLYCPRCHPVPDDVLGAGISPEQIFTPPNQ